MTIELKQMNLSKESLESLLVTKWGYNPGGVYTLNSSIILYCDAALQLKKRGYEAVTGIKNSGIPYAKIFEMMGYTYSEIDYSCHKRHMVEPIIDNEDIERMRDKKVILCDVDYFTGRTLQTVNEYLTGRKINVEGIFIGQENGLFGWITEKGGIRKQKGLKAQIQSIKKVPKNFEIFTSTNSNKISEAIKRVSSYLMQSQNI
jgi:hypothetical protein